MLADAPNLRRMPPAALAAAVFSTAEIAGQPQETEEMAPVWISTQDIPYDKMWADDVHWYPLFLQGGTYFQGLFAFTNTHTLVWHNLQELQDMSGLTAAEALLSQQLTA